MKKPQQPSARAFAEAADFLNCEIAAIRAVAEVESGGKAFLPSGEPVILFEPHVFDRLTGGKFRGKRADFLDRRYNELSYPKWNPKAYGPVSAQHVKLAAAAELDREAALRSASWGLLQIMGHHHARCGHDTIQSFVNAMHRSAGDHLSAFVHFIATDEKLLRAIQRKDWAALARGYNGSGYKANRWDTKMAAAYAKWSKA